MARGTARPRPASATTCTLERYFQPWSDRRIGHHAINTIDLVIPVRDKATQEHFVDASVCRFHIDEITVSFVSKKRPSKAKERHSRPPVPNVIIQTLHPFQARFILTKGNELNCNRPNSLEDLLVSLLLG